MSESSAKTPNAQISNTQIFSLRTGYTATLKPHNTTANLNLSKVNKMYLVPPKLIVLYKSTSFGLILLLGFELIVYSLHIEVAR